MYLWTRTDPVRDTFRPTDHTRVPGTNIDSVTHLSRHSDPRTHYRYGAPKDPGGCVWMSTGP